MTQTPDFSVKPTISGEKVVLRPFTEDDLPGMLQVLTDPEALRLTGTVHDDGEPASLADGKRFRDWYSSRNDRSCGFRTPRLPPPALTAGLCAALEDGRLSPILELADPA